MRHSRQGFILVIVVAILGVLAALATQLAQKSSEAKKLSGFHMGISRVRLMCRSGLEYGIHKQIDRIVRTPALASRTLMVDVALDPAPAIDVTRVTIKDMSGCINPNDGVKAGLLELGPDDYSANQVDPWPSGTPASPWPNPAAAPGTGNAVDNVTVISGMINLRLRAMLNAFGDAHRYIAAQNLGWPGSAGHIPGSPFTFTSTESGPRGVSAPSRNAVGVPLSSPATIASDGRGLGDRIIASRPQGGYSTMVPVADLVNAWGNDHLPSTYLEGRTFYEKVSDDLALETFEDDRFFRLFEEHGRFEPDYFRPLARRSQIKTRMFMDSQPPDFVNRQKFMPHSVALINLNAASDLVKAAVFYAPSNVSYVCEGAALDVITPDGKYMKMKNAREWLGVGGPSFEPTLMTENGDLVSAQSDRLMSLTDALKLSLLYGQELIPPASFPQFEYWLTHKRMQSQIHYERARIRTFGGMRPPYITPPNDDASQTELEPAYFTQEYIEKTLPHIFSCVRRLPGYLGAPSPLMSPYLQQGEHRALWYHHAFTGAALRSAEDFVFRAHLPKVTFMPLGRLRVRSKGTLNLGSQSIANTLTAELKLHETRFLRTQGDFESHTVSSTNSDILIGPEPRIRGATAPFPVPPSDRLGVVGLRDHCEEYPTDDMGQVHMVMPFDGLLNADATSNLFPADSTNVATDSHLTGSITERPPSPGYPDLRTDDWLAVKGKLDRLRNAPIDTIPTRNRVTWRYPRPNRDLRMELYMHDRGDPNPAPTVLALNAWFTAYRANYRDRNGVILDLVNDGSPSGETLDEISYNVTQVVNHPLIDVRSVWYMWATLGPNQAINWSNGAPRQGDLNLMGSNLEGPNASLFAMGSSGSDLSPFGGILLSSRAHGARSNFADSLYLRPVQAYPSGTFKTGEKFNRGYVSLWVRMPSGYHSSNVRRSLFHLNLWDKTNMKAKPATFTGGTASALNTALAGTATVSTYRPTQFSVYLEGDTAFSGDPDALYSVVAKHQKDVARRAYTPHSTMLEELCPYPNMLSDPIYPDAASFAASSLRSNLAPLTQYGYPPSLLEPQNNMVFEPVVDYNNHWRTFAANLDSWVLRYPDQNANASKEMLLGPYANLPGSWRRVVCRWDLQIPPQNGNQRLFLVTDPHMTAVSRKVDQDLLPGSTHLEKTRPYHGICDGNPGMIWSFGETVACYDPEYSCGGGVFFRPTPDVYRGGIISNFTVNHASELSWSGMPALYPDAGPFPYPTLGHGRAMPLMRLNSSLDNIVIRMGETAVASVPANPTRDVISLWVQSEPATQSRRYLVDSTLIPPSEPEWVIQPNLPAGSRLLYVGARVYDPPFIPEAQDAGILQPWQSPVVDYEVEDVASGVSFPMDAETSTAASHAGYVYSSVALRRPLLSLRTGPSTRLKVVYKDRDARGEVLGSDGEQYNFNDIPWIQEVSWSYIPSQTKFLSFAWD
ncbi:MAG: hypothetical protein AB7F75_10400 [Planctomycetota bacterium]